MITIPPSRSGECTIHILNNTNRDLRVSLGDNNEISMSKGVKGTLVSYRDTDTLIIRCTKGTILWSGSIPIDSEIRIDNIGNEIKVNYIEKFGWLELPSVYNSTNKYSYLIYILAVIILLIIIILIRKRKILV